MKTTLCMIYKEVIEKRLARKREQLATLEHIINSEGVPTPIEKRKFIETKAVVTELENVLDIADTMFEHADPKVCMKE
ncbi:hypothetical protein [Alistipes indistinctus]|jgi:hypothetical protein|uniref:hypothetical protein n=1 Tax=Alistipes indistinctus TaxID=626932 RepID=UPI002066E1B8|nr:MAG TPA: hypothetical protein [Caudoviricetes sp.]